MENNGLFVFLLVFLLIVLAGIGLANQNQIMPAVAQAEASASIGTETFLVMEKGVALLLKFLVGAIVAGVAAAAFGETKKAYNAWKKSAQTGRWQGGPNARWQTTAPKAPSEPRLTRQDLMLLALSGKYPAASGTPKLNLRKTRSEASDEELDVVL
jgi:uncharacterized membrane protein YdcZ (DUF606 family)